jgi:type VII secretion protein EccB
VATKKDLVEAQSFSKRRLTTAFVSGAPGGREVEPHRPMKAVIGGIALTVVLVLGSLAFGWLKGSLPNNWGNNKLVIAKNSGARYVSIKDTLHPILNTTSARLLIPANSFEVITVADDKLATKKRGATIGILGAPDSLTPGKSLTNTGWVSCLGSGGGVATAVGPSVRSTPTAAGATVVMTGRQPFVIAGGMRYPVPANQLDDITLALGLDGSPPRQAPAVWTNLFALGPDLTKLTLPGFGKSAPGLPPGATIGSVLAVASSGQEARRYLVNSSGELEPLPDFAHALYGLGSGSTAKEDLLVTPAQVTQLKVVPQQFAPKEWPTQIPTLVNDAPCASLTAATGTRPTVALSTSTTVKPEPGVAEVAVDLGTGALVRAIGAGSLNAGPLLAIDQTGTSYAIDASTPDLLQRLGYQPSDVAPVPQAWTELFRTGPELSVKAAQTTETAAS